MKIIILGGAGFVGRNLVRVLKESKFSMKNIIVIDKDDKTMEYIKKLGPKTIVANLSKKGEWEKEFKGIDVVINLIAQISSTDPKDFIKNNIDAAKNTISAMKKAKKKDMKLIHFSSAAVLSVRKDDYSITKKKQEELMHKSGFKYFTIRPSLMYGPTDTKNIGYLIDFAKKFPFFPIPGSGEYIRQPVYIDDICKIVINTIKKFPKKNTVVGINGIEKLFFRDMIQIVLKELKGFRFLLHLPIPIFKFLMMSYQGIIGKKQFTTDQVDSLESGDIFPDYPWWDKFNIKPTTFKQGIKKMLSSKY